MSHITRGIRKCAEEFHLSCMKDLGILRWNTCFLIVRCH